jgi:D-glycero-D-manno-heptose 1,7-bisphosphate phosphatase
MTLVNETGLWCKILGTDYAGRPAIFLDRDGVVVEDVDYLARASDLHMIAGSAAAVARCNRLGIPVILVSNQSGIGRGFYGWSDFAAVQAALSATLAEVGAHFDAVLACAYHADAQGEYRVADHPWRKPNPGMLREAATRMHLDLSNSWIIGDRASDLAAGQAASLRGGVLVVTGYGQKERETALELGDQRFAVRVSPNLAAAVEVPIAWVREAEC